MKPALTTILGELNLERLSELVNSVARFNGEAWECGVYKGGSAVAIFNALGTHRTIRLFDTFGSGIPEASDKDTANPVGRFSITKKQFLKICKFSEEYPNIKIHKGYIPDTFKGLENSIISFAHIDVDNALSHKNCINFIWPRLLRGGVMLFDDYGVRGCEGATEVITEFALTNSIQLLTSPETYGAWIRK